jgi:hypothetical protein
VAAGLSPKLVGALYVLNLYRHYLNASGTRECFNALVALPRKGISQNMGARYLLRASAAGLVSASRYSM